MGRLAARMLFGLLVLMAACGDAAVAVPMQIRVAWQPLLACTQRAQVGARMQASLDLGGGYPRCPLSVDPGTLEVSGSCPEIAIGSVVPLGLGYWYPQTADSSLAGLLYIIGWVDLRRESVGDYPDRVAVQLVPDGVHAVVVDRNLQRDILHELSECEAMVDETERNLCTAEGWAKATALSPDIVDFDVDADGARNIEEACAGTI